MKIYAHRGSSGENPEMTRAAYQAAIDEGADGFECDVRLSRDGEIVCIHDGTTKRIANKNLRVSRNDLNKLQSVQEFMALTELLDLAISAKKDLLIETKHPVLSGGRIERKVVQLLELNAERIKASGIEVIVMSFSSLAVKKVNSKWSVAKVSKYYLPARFSRQKISALDIELIAKHPALVSKLSKNGSRVLVWTVNKKSELELCKTLGVDGVITNYPKVARNNA